MQQIDQLLDRVRAGQSVEFEETMDIISAAYEFHPTVFTNGRGERAVVNGAEQNQGSCKILFFAKLNGLTEPQTLALFGRYYRDDVLGNPEGNDHQNIRNFMQSGWAGVNFAGEALVLK